MDPVQKVIQSIIKPELLQYYSDWIQTANTNEARGLQLIGAIYQNKGRKKFRAIPPSVQLKSLHEKSAFDYKKAEEMFRKSQTTSHYTQEFSKLEDKKSPKTNIFKFKKCKDLELCECLTPLAIQFIDNWLDLKDEKEFEELILICLRSLNSRYKAQQVNISEARNKFDWKVDWNLCKPLRIDKAGDEFNTYKTNYNAIFKQRLKEEQMNEKLKEFQKSIGGKHKMDELIRKTWKV